jgi:hypothetical protein
MKSSSTLLFYIPTVWWVTQHQRACKGRNLNWHPGKKNITLPAARVFKSQIRH